jgi:hypothetical protein
MKVWRGSAQPGFGLMVPAQLNSTTLSRAMYGNLSPAQPTA